MKLVILLSFFGVVFCAAAQEQPNTDNVQWKERLKQTDQAKTFAYSNLIAPKYRHLHADYNIAAELNDDDQTITGLMTIKYTNTSPNELGYLWLQLGQSILEKKTQNAAPGYKKSASMFVKAGLASLHIIQSEGGYTIKSVQDSTGKDLPYMVNKTMMRVSLPQPLPAGSKYSFKIEWLYNIINRKSVGARSGYELYSGDNSYIYNISQWIPRMCEYDGPVGTQSKTFPDRVDSTFPFGCRLALTVPADQVMLATGTAKNLPEILTTDQLARFKESRTYENSIDIVTEDEVIRKGNIRSREKKTWQFEVHKVGDFSFVSSRKYMWISNAIKDDLGRYTGAYDRLKLVDEGNSYAVRGNTRSRNLIFVPRFGAGSRRSSFTPSH